MFAALPMHSPSPPTPHTAPQWVRAATRAGVLLVIVGVAGVALLVASGAFDPPVAGPVAWSDDALRWADGPRAALVPGVAQWWPARQTLPAGVPFTLDVRARFAAGAHPLAAWGVWVQDRDGARTLYAISAGGYWTIRTCPVQPPPAVEDCPAPDPAWRWSPFPRIHPPGETNTITLHCETRDCAAGGALRLRVNGERLGAPVVAVGGVWGVWARSGAEPAILTWQGAALAHPAP